MTGHNHSSPDIKPHGICRECDETRWEVSAGRIMFLGGSLDHATREVPIEVNGMPVEDKWIIERIPRARTSLDHIAPPDPPREEYVRIRCQSGAVTWWAYVLHDHNPTPSQLLDARPYL
jgi:hypothetical protein